MQKWFQNCLTTRDMCVPAQARWRRFKEESECFVWHRYGFLPGGFNFWAGSYRSCIAHCKGTRAWWCTGLAKYDTRQ